MKSFDNNINCIEDDVISNNENSNVVIRKKASKKTWQITTIILGILVVILTIGHILVYVSTQWVNNEMEKLNSRILSLQEENEEIRDERSKVAEKCRFYFDYVAIVPKNSKTYHLYSCKKLDTSEFYIYSQKDAISRGYTACQYCAEIFSIKSPYIYERWKMESNFIYQ